MIGQIWRYIGTIARNWLLDCSWFLWLRLRAVQVPARNFQYIGLNFNPIQLANDVKTLEAIVPPRLGSTSRVSTTTVGKGDEDTFADLLSPKASAAIPPVDPRLSASTRAALNSYATSPCSANQRQSSHHRTRSYNSENAAPTISQQLLLDARQQALLTRARNHSRSASVQSEQKEGLRPTGKPKLQHARRRSTHCPVPTVAGLVQEVKASRAYHQYRQFYGRDHPESIDTPRYRDAAVLEPSLHLNVVLSWRETIESKARGLHMLHLLNKNRPGVPAPRIF